MQDILRRIYLFLLQTRIQFRHIEYLKEEESTRFVWHKAPIGLVALYAGMVFLWFWGYNVPSPSKAAVALAVAAGIMALLGEMGGKEKLAWIFLLLGFLVVEFKAIDKDRADAEIERRDARNLELRGFSAVAMGINHSIDLSREQFDQNMMRSDRIIAGVSDTIKTQTGGNSFAFITFTAEPAQAFEMHWNNFLAPRGVPYFLVSVTSHGKYPLRGTRAIMMDDERRLVAMQEYNKHPNGDWITAINSADSEYQMPYLRPQSTEAPQGEVDVIGLYPMPQGDSKRLTINFSAPNGYWNEGLHLGRLNGAWHQCLSVLGPTVKQAKHPFIYCDSDWPEGKKLAEKDWVFTPPKKQ
jgi:hypothetical protein